MDIRFYTLYGNIKGSPATNAIHWGFNSTVIMKLLIGGVCVLWLAVLANAAPYKPSFEKINVMDPESSPFESLCPFKVDTKGKMQLLGGHLEEDYECVALRGMDHNKEEVIMGFIPTFIG